MINTSDDRQKFYSGTRVASMSPVEEIKTSLPGNGTDGSIPEHLKELYDRTVAGVTKTQCTDVAKLLIKYSDTFSTSDYDLGRTGVIKYKIKTKGSQPIEQPLRRAPVHMNDKIDGYIDVMLQKDVIQPLSSPWASGIVMVRKKDGSLRFCVDYRKLYDVTVKDSYPLPRIDYYLEQLSGASWFSCLDLNCGY